MKKVYETDWLASKPIFYNEKTYKVSENINEVIDYRNMEFHAEGLKNYIDFGYSVFEQTPIKNVKFLRHSSRITTDENSYFKVEYLPDPAEKYYDTLPKEQEIWELLSSRIQTYEKSIKGEIIIPTSGGYDSRILNFFVKDKAKIKAFTYGISQEQGASYEVQYARKLSEILKIDWQQIYLGEFHNEIDEWLQYYGLSTHAHGMYHFEFYKKIIPHIHDIPSSGWVSGIIGDAWAGSITKICLETHSKLDLLSYSHGMKADSNFCLLKSDEEIKELYWEENKYKLQDLYWQTLETMRIKLILLSYLTRVPKLVGFNNVYSPYLDIDIALMMNKLPQNRRNGRVWQKEFFVKHNINIEDMGIKANKSNSLDFEANQRVPVQPLNVTLLREVFDKKYLENINQLLSSTSFQDRAFYHPILGRVLGRLKVKNKWLEAYCAYLTLLPIQDILLKRNNS